jgi:hypothetical protein
MQKTLCNKRMLRDGNCVFTNFNYVNKIRDDEGDIVVYNATMRYKGEQQQAVVSVQNYAVIAWQT